MDEGKPAVERARKRIPQAEEKTSKQTKNPEAVGAPQTLYCQLRFIKELNTSAKIL